MKQKFLIAIVCCFSAMVAIAQDGNVSAKQTEPTVNGKPYSQYKAEQEALKRQREAQKKIAAPISADIVALNHADAKPVPAKTTAPKPDNDGGAKPIPVTEQAVVGIKKADTKMSTRVEPTGQPGSAGSEVNLAPSEIPQPINQEVKETEKPRQTVTPEVPVQFQLKSNASWGTAPVTESRLANLNELPKMKEQQTQNGDVPYKTVAPDTKPAGPDMKPTDAKVVSSAIVSADTKKANPAPEVPSQFRLPEAQSWNGRGTEAATAKSNTAQSVDAGMNQQYKAPVMDKTNKESGNEGKPIINNAVDAKFVQAPAPKKEAVAPEMLPGTGFASVAAPAVQKATRSQAEIDAIKAKEEAEKQKSNKPEQEIKKNTTPPPGMVTGVGNGEVSKVSVEKAATQQEPAPAAKKD